MPILPEVIELLNNWDQPAYSDCCPRCGGKLTDDMLKVGGGYRLYEICQSEGDCDFMRRAQ